MSTGNRHRWLHGELPSWIEQGLITFEQAEQLRARYPIPHTLSWGRIILSSIGAILFGLGVILLFAYNWEAMPKAAKLAAVFGTLVAAHTLALWYNRRADNPAAVEGLHALGTMLFGAGIWLVAQIYHIDEHYPNAFILWGCGALLLAWALPSLTQALMAVALVLVWQLTETFDFQQPMHSAPWIILLAVAPLIRRLGSAVLAGTVSSALIVTLSLSALRIDDDLLAMVLLLICSLLVAVGGLAERYPALGITQSGQAIRRPALLGYFAMLYLLSYPDVAAELIDLSPGPLATQAFVLIPLVLTLAAWGLLLSDRFKHAELNRSVPDLLVAAGLLPIILSLAIDQGGGWLIAVPFNLLFLAQSLALIIQGSQQAHARSVVLGCLMLALLAMSRYVDLFDSLISRALVFFLIGGGLFLVGNRYQRQKRQGSAGR